MKCKTCDGSGITKGYDAILGRFFDMECPDCDGSGEVDHYEEEKEEPMTNEEFLRTASVNDMARCIATKLLELARHEYGIYDVVDYATVFEWLKEVHKE